MVWTLLVPGRFVVPLKLGTFGSQEEIQHSAGSLEDQLASKAELSVADVAVHHTVELENLFAAVPQVKSALVGVVAAVEFAVVAVDVPGPYNAAPIPSLHLANYRHPFQQKPWGSCTVGSPRSRTSVTCFARSYVALVLVILDVSFLLLASACLPPPLLATSFSLILLHLATAVGAQATVP